MYRNITAAAIKSNAAAADVDRNYIAATGATGMYPAMYYSHNLHFLAYAAMQAGKSDEARKAAEQYDVKTFQSMMRDKAKRGAL